MNYLNTKPTIKLTQYSHGAGCGCKISPSVLSGILNKATGTDKVDPRLLIGNETSDDAAVYDLGNGNGIISTSDFFMPIVDDPFTFGAIAATNALSDIYAMGGKPLMAISILGWPVDKIDPGIASVVLSGAQKICNHAGISIAGGHSIDCPEPIFGLAVTGIVPVNQIKRNNTAREGCLLYLTKPLGTGVLSTAQKRGVLRPEDAATGPESMLQLNDVGEILGKIEGVAAMTDVTGFGLLGHLGEMCRGSQLSAVIQFEGIPLLPNVEYYIEKRCIPGGTNRNWQSYGDAVQLAQPHYREILCDPQTSGGLLLAVLPDAAVQVEQVLKDCDCLHNPFGRFIARDEFTIRVD